MQSSDLLVFMCFFTKALFKNTVLSESKFTISTVITNHEAFYISGECITNVINEHIEVGSFITIVYQEKKEKIEGTIIQKEKEGVVDYPLESITSNSNFTYIVRSFDDKQWLITTPVYIIFAKDVQEFSSGIVKMTYDLLWNPRAKFIVQIDDNINNNELQIIFSLALKYKIFNIIVLAKSDWNKFVVYTYNPFDGGNCGSGFDDIITIGNCKNAQSIEDLFPYTVPDGMKNCTVNILLGEDIPNVIFESSNFTIFGEFVPGLEQYLLETISELEGFTVVYEYTDPLKNYGIILPNHTATGLLRYLKENDRLDMLAGGYVMVKNRIDVFDFVWGYNFGVYGVFTPAQTEERWRKIYKEFSPTTWMLTGISYVLVACVCISIHIRVKETRKSVDCVQVFLVLWGHLLDQSGKKLNGTLMRFVLSCWLWFTFFVINFYCTALYSLITGPTHRTRFIDADDLDNIPYQPCICEGIRILFEFAYNKSMPQGSHNIESCLNTQTDLETVASKTNLFAVETKYTYLLTEYKYFDDNGNPKLDVWDMSINIITVLYTIKGYPYVHIFQKHAFRMFEVGLVKNHLDKIYMKNTIMLQRKNKIQENKIRLVDLIIPWMILSLGTSLSFITLVVECVYSKRKQTKAHAKNRAKIFIAYTE